MNPLKLHNAIKTRRLTAFTPRQYSRALAFSHADPKIGHRFDDHRRFGRRLGHNRYMINVSAPAGKNSASPGGLRRRRGGRAIGTGLARAAR